jgi:TolB-like protein
MMLEILPFRIMNKSAESQVFGKQITSYVVLKSQLSLLNSLKVIRFEVFTAVNMKNAVFWDVTPCDSCKNRHF